VEYGCKSVLADKDRPPAIGQRIAGVNSHH